MMYAMRYVASEREEVMRCEVRALVVPDVHQRLWNAESAGCGKRVSIRTNTIRLYTIQINACTGRASLSYLTGAQRVFLRIYNEKRVRVGRQAGDAQDERRKTVMGISLDTSFRSD